MISGRSLFYSFHLSSFFIIIGLVFFFFPKCEILVISVFKERHCPDLLPWAVLPFVMGTGTYPTQPQLTLLSLNSTTQSLLLKTVVKYPQTPVEIGWRLTEDARISAVMARISIRHSNR